MQNFMSPAHDHETTTYDAPMFRVGEQFPPVDHVERLSKYERGRKIFQGKHYEVYYRAQSLLANTPFSEQLKTLYIACNIVDVIVTKPADLMFGEAPTYETGKAANSKEQEGLSSIVEENDLATLGHEIVLGAGYRGDSFLKTYFDYRDDYSALGFVPVGAKMEAIIEAQDPSTVFPEPARGSRKKFKAVNIAFVEWEVDLLGKEIAFLNVERHIPGFIQYARFRLLANGPDNFVTEYGAGIPTYTLSEQVPTGRASDVIETGVPKILIQHIPYKTTDEEWQGISTVEKIETLIGAINDRLVQIDYILLKHSDPTAFGPDLDGESEVRWGGKYIPVRKDDVTPAYMVWNGQLDAAFKELGVLMAMVYQIAETPQWLFGTTVAGDTAGGSGTSHTDGSAIKARFMPIISKVKRIRSHVDKALRDALYAAMQLDNVGNKGVDGFATYEPAYPVIKWRDGIPRDEKAMAEVMSIRTGGLATIDQLSAIKDLDGLDDEQAQEIIDRIKADEQANSFVSPSAFNQPGTTAPAAPATGAAPAAGQPNGAAPAAQPNGGNGGGN